jgi:hypothetical protein
MWDPNFVVLCVKNNGFYGKKRQFRMALIYEQEENMRINGKVQISSDNDVDASSGRAWTVISFEKNKQM